MASETVSLLVSDVLPGPWNVFKHRLLKKATLQNQKSNTFDLHLVWINSYCVAFEVSVLPTLPAVSRSQVKPNEYHVNLTRTGWEQV